jgi:hypothetical protein
MVPEKHESNRNSECLASLSLAQVRIGPHGQCFSQEILLVLQRAGRIDRHQVAFVAVLAGIAMASVEEQQAVTLV